MNGVSNFQLPTSKVVTVVWIWIRNGKQTDSGETTRGAQRNDLLTAAEISRVRCR